MRSAKGAKPGHTLKILLIYIAPHIISLLLQAHIWCAGQPHLLLMSMMASYLLF